MDLSTGYTEENRVNKYLKVLRPEQWYKNLLVFLPLLFSGNLFNFSYYPLLLISFFSLCLVSGVVYLSNDLHDYEEDRQNPEKRHRPIASGEISLEMAWIYWMILCVILAVLIIKLPLTFVVFVFLNSTLYTVFFKKHELLDVVSISCNYIFRVLQGFRITNTIPNFSLLLSVFAFAMMMSAGKRIGEYKLMGENASKQRSILTSSYVKILEKLLLINCAVFLVSFTILFGNVSICILPLIMYLVGKYLSFLETDPYKVRHPHALFKDRIFMCVFGITCLVIFVLVGGII